MKIGIGGDSPEVHRLRNALISALYHENDNGTHRYFSTHCHHGAHDSCKGVCKSCPSVCVCECHREGP